jgi:glycosyltransferase involved in cell wall biosynthesis
MDEPLVSIVTPVYNGAEYLEECIDSVLRQTYTHWDYTVVDNASTDATPDIAQRYAARESRMRYLRFDDLVDITANHNRAFRAIHPESEFCKIVQADDWLFPECLSLMVDAAGVAGTVGIVSAYQLWERRIHLFGLPYETTFAPGHEILRSTLLGKFNLTGGPTATMLRSACVRERDPFYQDGFLHEDTEAMFWMLTRYDFAFVHQVLTFARRQPDARTPWADRLRSQKAEDVVFLLRYGKLVLHPDELRVRLRRQLMRYIYWHLRDFISPSSRDPSYFTFHAAKRRQILDEANGDPEVVAAMAVLGALLLRRRILRQPLAQGGLSDS